MRRKIRQKTVANGQSLADRQSWYASSMTFVVCRAKARASLVCRLKRKECCKSRLDKPEKSGNTDYIGHIHLAFSNAICELKSVATW